jgi:tetratricopeptide (TPR) repeat protein
VDAVRENDEEFWLSGPYTAKDNGAVAIWLPESVTWAVKFTVPVLAGVPESSPVAESVRLKPVRLLGLADSYNLMSVWGTIRSSEAFPKARSAAEMALSLDPNSAKAYNSLAFETYRYEWDFSGADREFRRLIALNPNYAVTDQWYGEFLGDLRRFDPSIAELRRARDLDPLSATAGSDLVEDSMRKGKLSSPGNPIGSRMAWFGRFGDSAVALVNFCDFTG